MQLNFLANWVSTVRNGISEILLLLIFFLVCTEPLYAEPEVLPR